MTKQVFFKNIVNKIKNKDIISNEIIWRKLNETIRRTDKEARK